MKRFMRFRRSLVIPVLAVILGLVVWPQFLVSRSSVLYDNHADYNRSTLLDDMMSIAYLPAIPTYLYYYNFQLPDVFRPEPNSNDATTLWAHNRNEYGDRPLYALLCSHQSDKMGMLGISTSDSRKRDRLAFIKGGRKIDPTNALYHLLLAQYYWKSAVRSSSQCCYEGKLPYQSSTVSEAIEGKLVINRSLLQKGLTEYRQARTKQLRLYRMDNFKVLLRHRPKAVLIDEYYTRAKMADKATTSIQELNRLELIAGAYIQLGQKNIAKELADTSAYMKLVNSDPQGYITHQYDISYPLWLLHQMMVINGDIALMDGNRVKSDKSRQCQDQLREVDVQPAYERSRMWMSPQLTSVLQNEMICITLCTIGAYAILYFGLRHIAWTMLKRRTHQQTHPHHIFRAPKGVVGYTTLGLAIFGLSYSALVTTGLTQPSMHTVTVCSILIITGGWVVFRHLFKRHCQQNQIAIPGRWVEVACNWLPILPVIGYLWLDGTIFSKASLEVVRTSVREIGLLLLLVLTVAVTRHKLRTTDYYIEANLALQRYLACLAVWVSLAVMPPLLMTEVVLLQRDNTGIGAYKSAELMQQRDWALAEQFNQKIQVILNKADR